MLRKDGADTGNELKTEVNLRNIVGRIVDLPTLPKVVSHLLCAVEDPRSSAREINLIMSNDPALAARILKLVNSSFYAMPSPVTSIQQAVVILGFNTVRSLALSASVFDTFAGKSGFSHEDFWLQSLSCALMCENLGARSDCLRIDSCFTLGLLHGIGKIILDQYAPAKFEEVIATARRDALCFEAAHQMVLGFANAEIGYWLAERWKISESVRDAIRFQNEPELAPPESRPLATAIRLARILCRREGCENGGDFDAPGEIDPQWWDVLEVEEQEMVEAELCGQLARADALFAQIKG